MRASVVIGCVIAVAFAAAYYEHKQDQSFLGRAKRDEIVKVATGDPAMEAARNKARATLPEFLATARQPSPAMKIFSLKVTLRDGDAVEHFWVSPFTVNGGGRFMGKLDNTPRSVRNVTAGQMIEFSENQISDWMYMDDGKMKGNYTACALLQRESKADQEAVKKRFGLNCEA